MQGRCRVCTADDSACYARCAAPALLSTADGVSSNTSSKSRDPDTRTRRLKLNASIEERNANAELEATPVKLRCASKGSSDVLKVEGLAPTALDSPGT